MWRVLVLRYITLVIILLIATNEGYTADAIIRPTDIARTRPRYKFNLIMRLLGYREYDMATNPPIPDSVFNAVSSFINLSSGINTIDRKNSLVEVYFKDAPQTGAYREKLPYPLPPCIPSVTYYVDDLNNTSVAIEANSKAILEYWAAGMCVINTAETKYLTSAGSLSKQQVFAKIKPILEHNDLSTCHEEYRIGVFPVNRSILSKDRVLWEAELGETVDFCNSTWVIQTTSMEPDSDHITMRITRCSGRLMELWYLPSPTRIQQWYDYQNTGKEQ